MKNRVKKSLSLLLAVIMMICAVPMIGSAESGEYTEEYYTYKIKYEHAEIISCDKSISGDIVIPETLGGYPVQKIGSNAFEFCNKLTSVIIPNSVTDICDFAFFYCTELISVVIPDSVTDIGFGAFESCESLKKIDIPDSISYIDELAFSFCSSLTSIVIPGSVDSIKKGTFTGCIDLENVEILDGVGIIEDEAFLNCTNLKSINIPNSVTSIGSYAFKDCINLFKINISDNIQEFGFRVFENTKWYNIQPDGDVYIGKIYYEYKGDSSKCVILNIKDGTKVIADYAIYDCENLIYISFPKEIENIGVGTFNNCSKLEKVTIPGSVKYILSSFENCEKLTDVTISDGVYEIYFGAFYGCSSLKSITIPKSVTHIGEETFGYYEDKKVENFTIYGYRNTAAENYANENGFIFIALDEDHEHTFKEWTVTTKATCFTEGKETRICSVCGENETRTIPATGHTDNNSDGKCDTCGITVSESEKPDTPSENCSCNCHKTGIANFFFKLLLFFQKIFGQNKTCKCGASHY